MSSPEERLAALGITLPPAPQPAANYVPSVRSGRLLFVSGQGPVRDGEVVWRGRVGRELTEAQGYEAAKVTILNVLAIARDALGTLDAVHRVVKLLVFVRCAEGFDRTYIVANGASDLLVEIFGDRGRHARSAVSAPELPLGIAVEIEAIFEVDADG